jgi:Fur family transcriptional regulator, ferric uptake regulator
VASDGGRARKRQAKVGVETAREKVREAGLRSTAPRIAVYCHLAAADRPISHAELFDALGPEGFDRATLYRNLIDLVSANLVTRTDHGDHVWRFELRRADEHAAREHPHFTCLDCGTVSCLPDVEVQLKPATAAAKPRAMQLDEVHLKGRCERCV